jgi:hypothetical protein
MRDFDNMTFMGVPIKWDPMTDTAKLPDGKVISRMEFMREHMAYHSPKTATQLKIEEQYERQREAQRRHQYERDRWERDKFWRGSGIKAPDETMPDESVEDLVGALQDGVNPGPGREDLEMLADLLVELIECRKAIRKARQ